MAEVTFYLCAGLTVCSFALFAFLSYKSVATTKANPPDTSSPRGVDQQGALLNSKDIVDLTEKFSKAGPTASSATLCIVFLFATFLSSGLLSVSVAQ